MPLTSGGATAATLVTAVQSFRRAACAYDGGINKGGTPGGSGAITSQVRHKARRIYPRGIRLNVGEGAVDGAPLLGGQADTRTQVVSASREGGKG